MNRESNFATYREGYSAGFVEAIHDAGYEDGYSQGLELIGRMRDGMPKSPTPQRRSRVEAGARRPSFNAVK